jgi:16S rRNA (guanine966-N2)-methyltransferase
VAAIRRNLTKTRLHGVIHEMDVFRFLAKLAKPAAYDVIFADPPYTKAAGGRDFALEVLQSEELRGALAADGILILEKVPDSKFEPDAGWESIRTRKYGSTEVAFLRSNAAA